MQQLRAGTSHELNHTLDRKAAGTIVSIATISGIKTEYDVQNWSIESENHAKVSQESLVPRRFAIIVQKVIPDPFLAKESSTSIHSNLQENFFAEFQHVLHLNLFVGIHIPTDDNQLWVWSISTLYRFMKKKGLKYNRITCYERTKMRQHIFKMRVHYLEWIEKYPKEGHRLYFQDEIWVFRNMDCNKFWTAL